MESRPGSSVQIKTKKKKWNLENLFFHFFNIKIQIPAVEIRAAIRNTDVHRIMLKMAA